ncbi:phage tail spike protein [Streptococcus suis]|uniref:phage tail spike protein n=1 Tax=Streptococcus suis TaxID=1307 RepID=UPI002A79D882|nr:phage tail protein [Streptococcus suis]HEL2325076.1 phage tail protein [Streptococcus suis]HEM2694942.1 phage tail protein [Streptococcus suis]HEM2709266.1 phage tail protein [Streptococcus suis]HEM2731950.1 phage tail protein [Streptococcus suis]
MLYLLDKDVKTVKWNGIPLHEASSAIVKEEINGDFTLTIRYPITDSGIYQLIKEDMLIKAPTPVLGPQLFRIKKPIENDDSLDITAYHISDDIMQRSINPVSVVGQGCAMALSQMVQNAKTDLGTFSFTSDIMDSRTFNTTDAETLYSVLLDGKHSIVGTWEGELVRDNFALTIKRSRGADRGVVITTHKNLKSYQRTKNSQSVVTRIHAKSTFKAEGAEEETTINVTVDSPLIGNYPYINEKDYENNNAKTVDELRKWAEAKFKHEGIDKVSDAIEIEAYELDGQVVHLGDTVNIKSRKHDVDLYKKAIAYEYNALTEEYISITFDDKPEVGGSGVSSGVSNVADVILNANRNAQEVAVERAIRNANQAFDAEFNKRVESINDGIEQSKAEAEAYADNIKQQIDGQLAESDRQYQLAQQNQDRQIAESLRIAGTSTNLANAARTLAEQANNDLIQVKASAESQARLILEQAQRQSELINRVTTVENVVDGTKVTVTELSKTLNKATGDIDSVTNRTKSVEDNLSQTRAQYEHLTQTVNAQTGQIDSINRKTVDLQSGIDGVTQRFENLQIGGNNLLKNTKDFSGEWDYNGQRRKIVPWKYNGLLAIEADYPWEGLTQLVQVMAGEVYTFSAYVASSLASDSAEIYIHLNNYRTEQMAVVDNYYRKFNMTATFQRVSITFKVITDGYIAPRIERSDLNGILYFAGMKLERGTIATDWYPAPEDATNYADTKIAEYKNTVDGRFATIQSSVDNKANLVDFQRVQETARLYERIIGSTETGIKDKVARMVMADSLFLTEVKDKISGTATQVNQLSNSWAVKNLTSAGTVLNQFNLLANGTNRIDGRLTHITGQTLIDNGVINNAMIGNLDAGKITTGYLASARIATNSITGSHMVFDQAFVDKMTANKALFKQLFAQSAFITSVQAVTMSAGQIVGGVLKATNGAAEFDLNNAKLAFNSSATIEFNSSGNALIRKVGDVTGFLHFNNATAGGTYVGLGVTSHNEGVKSQNTGRFAGIRIFRSNDTTDQTEIYGDKIYLGHGFNGNGITITATKLSTSYELVDVINSIRALWRCWLHWNGTGWNPDDMAMRRSVINEYNTYNIG